MPLVLQKRRLKLHSREIEEQIKALDGKRRGAVAESIRHTVEATDALTRATLLVAYGQLRTAEEMSKINAFLEAVAEEEGLGIKKRESASPRSNVLQQGPIPERDELPNLGPERVSIPK